MAKLRPNRLQLPIPALADKAAFATSYRRTCRGDAHVVAQAAEARDLPAVLSPVSRVARQLFLRPIAA